MRHVPLNELQVGIKVGVRNNHLRFADDCPLLAESKEELKSFLMRVKEESERMDLRLKKEKKKAKIMAMASGSITAWQTEGKMVEVVTDFLFLGSKITVTGDCGQEIRRQLLIGRKAMANLDSILKSRDITLLTKVCVQSYGPPSSQVWL